MDRSSLKLNSGLRSDPNSGGSTLLTFRPLRLLLFPAFRILQRLDVVLILCYFTKAHFDTFWCKIRFPEVSGFRSQITLSARRIGLRQVEVDFDTCEMCRILFLPYERISLLTFLESFHFKCSPRSCVSHRRTYNRSQT